MDDGTTEFPMTAAVQPGNSGGPVLDGSGALLGVTLARMNDVAPSFLRVNGVEPKTGGAAAALFTSEMAAVGKAFTAQVAG